MCCEFPHLARSSQAVFRFPSWLWSCHYLHFTEEATLRGAEKPHQVTNYNQACSSFNTQIYKIWISQPLPGCFRFCLPFPWFLILVSGPSPLPTLIGGPFSMTCKKQLSQIRNFKRCPSNTSMFRSRHFPSFTQELNSSWGFWMPMF